MAKFEIVEYMKLQLMSTECGKLKRREGRTERESEREGEEELHNLLAKLESGEVVVVQFLNR